MWIRLHKKKCEICRTSSHVVVERDGGRILHHNAPQNAQRQELAEHISDVLRLM